VRLQDGAIFYPGKSKSCLTTYYKAVASTSDTLSHAYNEQFRLLT
jgi:hypothetical protein